MTVFNQKDQRIARESVIQEFVVNQGTIGNGFEFQGIGVDGPVFANEIGETIVLKVIAKKEVGIFNELIMEKDEKEVAAIARAEASKAKKERNIAAKAKAKAKAEAEATEVVSAV